MDNFFAVGEMRHLSLRVRVGAGYRARCTFPQAQELITSCFGGCNSYLKLTPPFHDWFCCTQFQDAVVAAFQVPETWFPAI